MSDDLVKRLRHGTAGDKERHAAADRIEKLEATLREMLTTCTWENNGRWCGSIDCHCRIARKALEGRGKMTDDLVKRLRRLDTCIFPTERDRCHCGEAADRIQMLEAALRDMLSKCTWEKRRQWCGSMGCHCQIASKALEGES